MVNRNYSGVFRHVHPVHHATLRTARKQGPRFLHELTHYHYGRNHHRQRKEVSHLYLALSLVFNLFNEPPVSPRFPERIVRSSSRESDRLENQPSYDVAVLRRELDDSADFFIVETAH